MEQQFRFLKPYVVTVEELRLKQLIVYAEGESDGYSVDYYRINKGDDAGYYKKVVYVEPADYIPKDLRKKHKLGEYAETEENGASEEKTMDVEVDYISKETRKKFKLGEFAEENAVVEMKVTVETTDGTLNADSAEEVEKLLEALDK